MTMVVDFVDGVVSNQTPNLLGLGNEIFPLVNNQSSNFPIDGLDFSGCSSVSAIVEIERKNATEEFRQIANVVFSKDGLGNWSLEIGSWKGDDLLRKDSFVANQDVVLQIDESGQCRYMSGNMDPYQYEGKFKFNLSRINA